jgi:hypothetical protein
MKHKNENYTDENVKVKTADLAPIFPKLNA